MSFLFQIQRASLSSVHHTPKMHNHQIYLQPNLTLQDCSHMMEPQKEASLNHALDNWATNSGPNTNFSTPPNCSSHQAHFLYNSPAKSPVLFYGGRTDCLYTYFCIFCLQMCGKQESPPTFISSNKGKGKRTEKTFFKMFLSTGGRL